MKNTFVLPTLCAAAIHAVFFFDFGRGRSVDQVNEPGPLVDGFPESITMVFPAPPEEIVEVVQSDAPESNQAEAPDLGFSPTPEAGPANPVPELGRQLQPIDPVFLLTGGPLKLQPSGAFSPQSNGVFSPGSLDRYPTPRVQVPPRYPEAMRRSGEMAEVSVTFVVNKDGRVISAEADTRAAEDFAREAERAVRRWRFDPGTRDGRPVSFRMCVPVVFAISSS